MQFIFFASTVLRLIPFLFGVRCRCAGSLKSLSYYYPGDAVRRPYCSRSNFRCRIISFVVLGNHPIESIICFDAKDKILASWQWINLFSDHWVCQPLSQSDRWSVIRRLCGCVCAKACTAHCVACAPLSFRFQCALPAFEFIPVGSEAWPHSLMNIWRSAWHIIIKCWEWQCVLRCHV